LASPPRASWSDTVPAGSLNALLALLLERSRIGVALLADDSTLLWANQTAIAMLRGLTSAGGAPRKLADLLRAPKMLLLSLTGRGPIGGLEFELVQRPQRWRIDLQPLPEIDAFEGGPQPRWAAALQDVSELQARRAELDREGTLLRDAARIAAIGAWEYDVASGKLRWSDETCAIHEVPPGREPDVQTAINYYDAQSRPLIAAAVDAAIQEGTPFDLELGFVSARGNHRRVRAIGSAEWRDGRVVRIAGLFHDVTERHAAREAISELTERLQLATAAAGVGIWDWVLEPFSVTWSDQMFRLYGLEPVASGVMSTRRWREMVHPEDVARVRRDIEMVMNRQLDLIDHQFRIVRPDGEVRHIHSVGRARRHGDGSRMIGINIDVTDRERSAQAVLDKHAAERASRAKSEFLSRVSHELRTPLNGILGFTQLLQQREDELAGWAARPLRQIRQAGDHLLALIEDMLDLAAIEAGRLRLSLEPVALDEVVREALALSTPLANDLGVRLYPLDGAGAPLHVRCDRTRLMQVLLNLLSNAIKFNHSGGDVHVRARGDSARRWVEVEIVDSGAGLSDEQQRGLFQRFNRLGAETSGVAGTGLGLTISRQLVEAMGGRIELRSAAGVGTCVTLQLPLAAAPRAPLISERGAAPKALPPAGERLRVLYVEDNPINVLLVQEALALHASRFELDVAPDGEQGLAAVEAARPDVVLLDINLPGISGHDVLDRLRADARFADLPCVAVSADAMPEEIARAREHGFDDYWTKPLDIARLPERLVAAAAVRGGRAA